MERSESEAETESHALLAGQLQSARLFLIFPVRAGLGRLDQHLSQCAATSEGLLIDTKRYGAGDNATLWQELPLALSSDLDPIVAGLLGYNRSGQGLVFWQFDSSAREDLNRRVGAEIAEHVALKTEISATTGFGLAISLSDAALRRLGREESERFVPIRLVNIEFYLSQTRLGQLVVEVQCGKSNVRADLLIEVAHQLSNGQYRQGGTQFHRLSSRREVLLADNGKAAPGSFSVHELVQALACPNNDETCMVYGQRAFTYILATTDTPLPNEKSNLLAARLARRHNADYSPQSALEGVYFATPFETVTHACTSEGGALLVTNASSVKFLTDFADGPGAAVYLPLALLAHKNMHDLVALSQGTAITIEHSERENDIVLKGKLDQIQIMQERVLNYRLAHRFSLAGFGVNHNLVHAAWRKATNVDEMLREIDGDVTQASAYLAAAREGVRQKREAEARTILLRQTSWLQAGLVFFAVIEGMHVVRDLIADWAHWPSPNSRAVAQLAGALGLGLSPEVPLSLSEQIANLAPLLIALVAAIAVWKNSRRGGHISTE